MGELLPSELRSVPWGVESEDAQNCSAVDKPVPDVLVDSLPRDVQPFVELGIPCGLHRARHVLAVRPPALGIGGAQLPKLDSRPAGGGACVLLRQPANAPHVRAHIKPPPEKVGGVRAVVDVLFLRERGEVRRGWALAGRS